MQKILLQLKQFWAGRDKKQRMYLMAGGVLTAALLAVFANMIATPSMKLLMSGMEPADAQSLSQQLTAKGIESKLTPDGKGVEVPTDKLDQARLLAASDSQPHSGRMGFELFDKMSWGETEFDEKVNYQRALEGELERTIMTMAAVKSARVHLVMPTDSVFLDQTRSAKASVALKLRGPELGREEVAAIQRLVSGAVDGLKPGDVAVIDADSNASLGKSSDGAGDEEMEKRLEQRLIATLAPVIGADHIRASVNVDYEQGTTEQSQEKYDPTVSVPLTVQRSDEETGAGAVAGGVAGTASNVPQGKSQVANVPNVPGDGAESAKTENSTFGVNKTVTHTLEPAGRIRRLTAALLVDDDVIRKDVAKGKAQETRVKRSPEQLKQLQDLAAAAIGLDATRGDVLTVEDISFAQSVSADAPAPTMIDKLRRGVNDYASVIRYGALLAMFAMAWLLVLRPIQKRVLSASVEMKQVPTLPEHYPATQIAPPLPSDDVARAAALKEQLAQMVKAQPSNSARAVHAWLQGDAQ